VRAHMCERDGEQELREKAHITAREAGRGRKKYSETENACVCERKSARSQSRDNDRESHRMTCRGEKFDELLI